MPSEAEHLRWAERHFAEASALAQDQHFSWAVVARFYVALDLAHAVFACDSGLREPCRHPKNHTDADLNRPGTNAVIKRHYRGVETAYMALYAASLGIRYQGQKVDRKVHDFNAAKLRDVTVWAAMNLAANGLAVPDWMK